MSVTKFITRYTCDRCGRVFDKLPDDKKDPGYTTFERTDLDPEKFFVKYEPYTLCDKCRREYQTFDSGQDDAFADWMKIPTQEAEKAKQEEEKAKYNKAFKEGRDSAGGFKLMYTVPQLQMNTAGSPTIKPGSSLIIPANSTVKIVFTAFLKKEGETAAIEDKDPSDYTYIKLGVITHTAPYVSEEHTMLVSYNKDNPDNLRTFTFTPRTTIDLGAHNTDAYITNDSANRFARVYYTSDVKVYVKTDGKTE